MSDLFLKLLNMSVTAGWVVLALIAVRLVFRKAPKRLLCALWGIVGLRLLLPFTLKTGVSLIPSTETVSSDLVGNPVINSGFPAFNTVVNPVISQSAVSFQTGRTGWESFLAAAPYFWLCGIALMLAWAVFSYLRVRRQTRASVPGGQNVWLCDALSSPFILGFFRPRIYLPSDVPDAEKEFILAHERAHLKRLDHLWKPLGFLLLSVYWFHPLIWVAYLLLCRDIESACDERVIRRYTDYERAMYSQTILRFSAPRRVVAVCPVAFGETGVKERVKSVLSYKKPTVWILAAAVVLSVVLTVVFVTDPKKSGAPKNAAEAAGKYIVNVSDPKPLGFGASFTLSEDGTFRFSRGVAYSYMPSGKWTLDKNGTLTLRIENIRTYVFSWDGRGYAYDREKSDEGSDLSGALEIADGTVFVPASTFDGFIGIDGGSDEAQIRIEECTLTGRKKQVAFRLINNSDKTLFYGLAYRLYLLTDDGADAREIELPPHTLTLYAVHPGKESEQIVISVPDGLDYSKTFRLETDYRLGTGQEDEAYKTLYTATVFFGGAEDAAFETGGETLSARIDLDSDNIAELVETERIVTGGSGMTVIRAKEGNKILGETVIPFLFASRLAFYSDAQGQTLISAKIDNKEMYRKEDGYDTIYLNPRLIDGRLRLFNTVTGDEFPWINQSTVWDLGTTRILSGECDNPAQRVRFTVNSKGENAFRMTFGTGGESIQGNYTEAPDGTLTLKDGWSGDMYVFDSGTVYNKEKSSSDAGGRLRDGAYFHLLYDEYETDLNGDGEKEWLYLIDGGTSGFCTYRLIAENEREILCTGGIIAYQSNYLRLAELIDGRICLKSEKSIFWITPDDWQNPGIVTEFFDIKPKKDGFHFYYVGSDEEYDFGGS